MNYAEFSTEKSPEALSREVTCLKMMVTMILQSMSQVDSGKAILKMERYLATAGDNEDTALLAETLRQIKSGYLQ
ncbi:MULTISPECIES: DUF2594 family protein [Tatumella]|uniref:Protein of uncharacterized function (DUF2594) n=2 Tax=Tatumella ptyseos TaxID=82987 RepID=A0A2X5R6N5_9GAMM|nr:MULTISPECIES: DUF2594 family protein [Tatumella]KFD18146.1 putative cytoplasmic protein [Tatumella ptyseos ATCC 33301]SQK74245.1 Protein of uncharacterised function (DUF2594) [Tatumella ptyseos]